MLKSEDKFRSTFGLSGPSDSGIRPRATGSGPSRGAQAAGTKVAGNPVTGNVGFVGLGRMGTAMAGNLAAAGRQVVVYVRRAERISELEALGLRPTTEIADLFDCSIVISMWGAARIIETPG
jgi:lactate dehydrogenase-like 2-hydroxyacid dehydrogenase